MTALENHSLAGNLAPVRDELTVTDLEVEGAIPPAPAGRLPRARSGVAGEGYTRAMRRRNAC